MFRSELQVLLETRFELLWIIKKVYLVCEALVILILFHLSQFLSVSNRRNIWIWSLEVVHDGVMILVFLTVTRCVLVIGIVQLTQVQHIIWIGHKWFFCFERAIEVNFSLGFGGVHFILFCDLVTVTVYVSIFPYITSTFQISTHR